MEIIQKKVIELKPDPNQPRQHFTKSMIEEMAISIKNEGIINPIEIDKNNTIITGEIRWRAAQKAELKTIHCKILEIDDNARFIRQMQENIHHNTMDAWDTAKGFDKTLKILSVAATPKMKHGGYRYGTKGLTILSKLYGPEKSTIREYLNLLKEPKEIQKVIKNKDFAHTKITEVNKSPKEYRKVLKDKIIQQQYIPRDAIRTIRAGLLRADMFGNKEAAKKILSSDYKDKEGKPMTNREVVLEVNTIIPDTQTILAKDIDRVKAITSKASELENFLKENSLNSIKEPMSKMSLIFQLKVLVLIINKYLSYQIFTSQLEEAKKDKIKLLKKEK